MKPAFVALLIVGALLTVAVGYVGADQVERTRATRDCDANMRPAACAQDQPVSPERLRAYCREHPRDDRCRA